MSKEFNVIVSVPTVVTVNAETAEQAVEMVKSQMNARDAASATFVVAEDVWYNEEDKCYYSVGHTIVKGEEENEHQENV